MNEKNALRGFFMGVLAALIVVGLGITPVLAQSGNRGAVVTNRPSGPLVEGPQGFGGKSPLVVPAAAFTSDGGDPDGFHFDFAGGYVNGDGTACLKAPVHLPAGAVVNSVYASLYDNAPGNIMVNLRRIDVSTGANDVVATLGTESDSTAIQHLNDSDIDHAYIVYPDYAYYLTTCLNYADHRLYSVRVYYDEFAVFLPIVLKGSS
jgi:hypothetical protein